MSITHAPTRTFATMITHKFFEPRVLMSGNGTNEIGLMVVLGVGSDVKYRIWGHSLDLKIQA